MRTIALKLTAISGACAILAGCSSAPGTAQQQGAVLGGATGAAVGASVTKNKALGAIIGGAVGAAGGYVVGGKTGHIDKKENAGSAPGSTTGSSSPTADQNNDGFVTLDEIAALEKSGLSDDEIIRRLEATNLTFDLNPEHRQYLADRGVSQTVLDRLPSLNRGQSPTNRAITPQ